jgi:hypothetical protein
MNPLTISCQVKNKHNETLDQRIKYWPEHLFSSLSISEVKIRAKNTLQLANMLINRPVAASWSFSNQYPW